MSELKAISSGEIYNIIEYEDCYRTDDLYYPKSEADKVIADLIEKNERLACKDIIMAREAIKDVYKELRHSNYKRCLAMAKWCDAEADVADADGDYEEMRWYQKWHKRWLELAEKFKINSTAQRAKDNK